MPMTVLICGSPADGFQIVGLFADTGDAESYAEDHSLRDWWVAGLISPETFAQGGGRLGAELAAGEPAGLLTIAGHASASWLRGGPVLEGNSRRDGSPTSGSPNRRGSR